MPEKKVIPISKKGSITISTWNSTENIEDSYDKLITDLPYECEVTEKG